MMMVEFLATKSLMLFNSESKFTVAPTVFPVGLDPVAGEIGPGLSLEQAAAKQATQVAAKPPDNLCKNSSRFMFILLVAIFQAINQINLVLFCE
jgi:hypothetical protein